MTRDALRWSVEVEPWPTTDRIKLRCGAAELWITRDIVEVPDHVAAVACVELLERWLGVTAPADSADQPTRALPVVFRPDRRRQDDAEWAHYAVALRSPNGAMIGLRLRLDDGVHKGAPPHSSQTGSRFVNCEAGPLCELGTAEVALEDDSVEARRALVGAFAALRDGLAVSLAPWRRLLAEPTAFARGGWTSAGFVAASWRRGVTALWCWAELGEEPRYLGELRGLVTAFATSPRHSTVALALTRTGGVAEAGASGDVVLFDAKDASAWPLLSDVDGASLATFAWSPDGDRLAVGVHRVKRRGAFARSTGIETRVYDIATARWIARSPASLHAAPVCWNADALFLERAPRERGDWGFAALSWASLEDEPAAIDALPSSALDSGVVRLDERVELLGGRPSGRELVMLEDDARLWWSEKIAV